MNKNNIGQEIIVLRAREGWTQQQLAEKLNTTQRTVVAWEAGESVPRKTMKVKMAQLFGLPETYFLELDKEDNNSESAGINSVSEEISELLSEPSAGLSENQKNQIMESFWDVVNANKNK